jgi:hypothetical protein
MAAFMTRGRHKGDDVGKPSRAEKVKRSNSRCRNTPLYSHT